MSNLFATWMSRLPGHVKLRHKKCQGAYDVNIAGISAVVLALCTGVQMKMGLELAVLGRL